MPSLGNNAPTNVEYRDEIITPDTKRQDELGALNKSVMFLASEHFRMEARRELHGQEEPSSPDQTNTCEYSSAGYPLQVKPDPELYHAAYVMVTRAAGK